jgi:hypothetical protein
MRVFAAILALTVLLCLGACNLAKNTADTAEKGGQSATGLAEKMSGGTVGETDMDSGESSGGDSTASTETGE